MSKYDLGLFRINDEEIFCGSYKTTAKKKSERIRATHTYDGIGWKNSEREYSFECSDVLPEYYNVMKEAFLNNTEFTVSTFNILEDGSYEEAEVFLGCIITDFDTEMNNGQSFGFKGEALAIQE